MKSFLNSLLAIALVLIMAACGSNTKQTESSGSEQTASAEDSEASFSVDTESSTISWRGEVAGVYGHDGKISISDGNLLTKGSTVTGGTIVIDMTTISPDNPESYKDQDGARASDLVNHLTTGDFFLVEEYPTATFVIKSHQGDKLVGDLTIRGNTNEEEATISSLDLSEDGLTAEASLVFDRQAYDVNWVHYMKDMVLSDDIQIGISIDASK